jgi:hypothetical protein
MGRGSQQKNDRPAHVFLKRATREQFREQRLRQGRSAFGRAGKSGVTPGCQQMHIGDRESPDELAFPITDQVMYM